MNATKPQHALESAAHASDRDASGEARRGAPSFNVSVYTKLMSVLPLCDGPMNKSPI